MARARSDKSLARFDRIALVLSGGGALGAYQAGAYAALENRGVRPNWIAGTAIGAINGAIIAGNLPHERVLRLRQFWQELSRRAAARAGGSLTASLRHLMTGWAARSRGASSDEPRGDAVIQTAELRELIQGAVDFERVNSGAVRLVLGAVNLVTGAETYFDNDRHVIGLDHVLASTALPGLPPVVIDRQRYGGGAVSVAALRRNHDLRRMIALLGERVPPALHGNADIRKCLAEASSATMTILHLVHEGNPAELAAKSNDFAMPALTRRWQAGENDVTTSLAHPLWLAPPPRRLGAVVHELRGGVAAPPR